MLYAPFNAGFSHAQNSVEALWKQEGAKSCEPVRVHYPAQIAGGAIPLPVTATDCGPIQAVAVATGHHAIR